MIYIINLLLYFFFSLFWGIILLDGLSYVGLPFQCHYRTLCQTRMQPLVPFLKQDLSVHQQVT